MLQDPIKIWCTAIDGVRIVLSLPLATHSLIPNYSRNPLFPPSTYILVNRYGLRTSLGTQKVDRDVTIDRDAEFVPYYFLYLVFVGRPLLYVDVGDGKMT